MFGRFSDKEVMDCIQGNEGMYMASEEHLDELRRYVDRKYPGLREEYRMSMFPPREKEPEKKQRRIYGYTDDELRRILGTDEQHPSETLRQYGLVPVYSLLKSMDMKMDTIACALVKIADELEKKEDE